MVYEKLTQLGAMDALRRLKRYWRR